MSIAVSLGLVVVFLIMNAFFVIAEFALVRVRKSQLELAIDEGKPGAKNAMKIAENVNAYLSACQLGITLASLALGWLGEPAISKLFEPLFTMLGLPEAAIVAISVAIGCQHFQKALPISSHSTSTAGIHSGKVYTGAITYCISTAAAPAHSR